MSEGLHWIVITEETEDRDAEFSLECDGVTASCETWFECMKCSPTLDEEDAGEFEKHGEFHQQINGYWSTPSGQCVLHALDGGESGWAIVLSGNRGSTMPPGRYAIDIDEAEEGTVTYSLAEPR